MPGRDGPARGAAIESEGALAVASREGGSLLQRSQSATRARRMHMDMDTDFISKSHPLPSALPRMRAVVQADSTMTHLALCADSSRL